jgi:hypothetical protein
MPSSSTLLTVHKAWLESLGSNRNIDIGVPKAMQAQASAYILLGGDRIVDEGGVFVEAQDLVIGIGYAVEDRADDAELAIATFKDEFISAFIAARKMQGISGPFYPVTNGGWTLRSATPDGSRNSTPQYIDWSRVEARHWVWLVTFVSESS